MNLQKILLAVIGGILYTYMGFILKRENFNELIALVALSSGLYGYLIQKLNESELLKMGLFYRVCLLFSIPVLSQDFYRFIWDGSIIKLGYSPYQYLPVDFLNYKDTFDYQNQFQNAPLLFDKMGNLSQNHYSNYPPINQLLFFIGSLFSKTSILAPLYFFKILIILADIGIVNYSKKLLLHFNINPKNRFLYFLNPLVLIELTGNCHFEGVMLFFLVLSFWYLSKKNWFWASFFMALSISTKLLPLLILPLFLRYLRWKALPFYMTTLFFVMVSFIPLLSSNTIQNYRETLSLWFVNFEFNASIYYLIRWIGFQIKGYNIIQEIGWILPLISMAFILSLSFFKENSKLFSVIKNCLWTLTFYFLMSTTIHPWYVINLVFLGMLTNLNYPIIGSCTVFLSYFAYANKDFKENYWLIGLEYILIFLFLIYEIRCKKLST
jgi:alpha-1,6-mannosyltransferase